MMLLLFLQLFLGTPGMNVFSSILNKKFQVGPSVVTRIMRGRTLPEELRLATRVGFAPRHGLFSGQNWWIPSILGILRDIGPHGLLFEYLGWMVMTLRDGLGVHIISYDMHPKSWHCHYFSGQKFPNSFDGPRGIDLKIFYDCNNCWNSCVPYCAICPNVQI